MLIQPIIFKINDSLHKIEDTSNLSSLNSVDKKNSIHLLVEGFSNNYQDLHKLNLCQYPPVAVLKNNIANRLRNIAIDISNNDKDYDLANFLLENAFKYAVSEDVINKIEKDTKIILENYRWVNFLEPKTTKLKTLIQKNEFSEANDEFLNYEAQLLENGTQNDIDQIIELLLIYCGCLSEKGNELMDQGSYIKSLNAFHYLHSVLTNRMTLFKFPNGLLGKQRLKNILEKVSEVAANCNAEEIEDLFSKINEEANHYDDENLQSAIRFLGFSTIRKILCERIQNAKESKNWNRFGNIIYGVLILIGILFSIFKNTSESKSSKQSTYRSNSSYSSTSSQFLTSEEKKIIEYLQKHKPDVLRDVRKQGFSDKQIARYVIDHADDEDE